MTVVSSDLIRDIAFLESGFGSRFGDNEECEEVVLSSAGRDERRQ